MIARSDEWSKRDRPGQLLRKAIMHGQSFAHFLLTSGMNWDKPVSCGRNSDLIVSLETLHSSSNPTVFY